MLTQITGIVGLAMELSESGPHSLDVYSTAESNTGASVGTLLGCYALQALSAVPRVRSAVHDALGIVCVAVVVIATSKPRRLGLADIEYIETAYMHTTSPSLVKHTVHDITRIIVLR